MLKPRTCWWQAGAVADHEGIDVTNPTAYLPPDWTLLGVPNPDGTVLVFASTKLTHGELEMVNEIDEYSDGIMWRARQRRRPDGIPDRTITLTVVMDDFVMVQAPDYATALQHLFATWKPEPARRPALATQRPALPS